MSAPEPIPLIFLPLDQVDWRDTTFQITYGRPLEPLVQSIRAVGVRHRPLVQRVGDGRLRIIAGRRRLRALQVLGRQETAVEAVSAEAEEADLFLLNFYEQVGARVLNPIEQALAADKLTRYFSPERVIREYLPLVGLPPRREFLDRCRILARISPLFWPDFASGRLFPEILPVIAESFPEWCTTVLALLRHLHFGLQKQKEALESLREIGRRRQEGIGNVLQETGTADLLRRADLTPQQKGETWRVRLRALLFPVLTATEQAFAHQLGAMGLDERTRLKPPPYFEGGRYALSIHFTSGAELESSLEKIGGALKSGKLDELP